MSAAHGGGPQRGARIGALVGFTSWTAALAIVCMAVGRFDMLVPVVLPLALASLGLGFVFLFVVAGAQGPERRPFVVGSVQTLVGVLVLLADAMLTPQFAGDPALAAASGSAVSMPVLWGFAMVQIAVGACVLAKAHRDMLRDAAVSARSR